MKHYCEHQFIKQILKIKNLKKSANDLRLKKCT